MKAHKKCNNSISCEGTFSCQQYASHSVGQETHKAPHVGYVPHLPARSSGKNLFRSLLASRGMDLQLKPDGNASKKNEYFIVIAGAAKLLPVTFHPRWSSEEVTDVFLFERRRLIHFRGFCSRFYPIKVLQP